MKIERIIDSFVILPNVSINWMMHKGKRYYYLTIAWLFWFIDTLKKFPWEDEQ